MTFSLKRRSTRAAILVCAAMGGLTVGAFATLADADKKVEVEVEETAAPGVEETAARQLTNPKDVLQGRPPFSTLPRLPVIEEGGLWPCTECHDDTMPADPTVRALEDEHDDLKLVHGGGRFWCFSCHHEVERDRLTSLKAQPISFEQSYLLCGQCHFARQQDFFGGAHGKRLGSWQGEPVLTPCTGCHDAHSPSIKPRPPKPPDLLRPGLQPRSFFGRPQRPPHIEAKVWERRHED